MAFRDDFSKISADIIQNTGTSRLFVVVIVDKGEESCCMGLELCVHKCLRCIGEEQRVLVIDSTIFCRKKKQKISNH
jgi:hypothetical protein